MGHVFLQLCLYIYLFLFPVWIVFFSSWSMGLAVTGIIAAAGIIAAGVKESQHPGEMLTYV